MTFSRILFVGLFLLIVLVLVAVFQGGIMTKGDKGRDFALMSVVTTAELLEGELESASLPITIGENGRQIQFKQQKRQRVIKVLRGQDGLFRLVIDEKPVPNILLGDLLFESQQTIDGRALVLRASIWGTEPSDKTRLPFVVIKSIAAKKEGGVL